MNCGRSNNSNSFVSVCLQLHCTIPVYSSCPTAIAIHPTTSNLVAVHADQQVNDESDYVRLNRINWSFIAFPIKEEHIKFLKDNNVLQLSLQCVFPGVCVLQIFEYSLVQKEYTQWSRRLQKQGLHSLWLERDTPVTHVSFSSKNPAHIFLHDMFMFCIIDQSLVCEHCPPC